MDFVKIWGNLLANYSIVSSVCTPPTTYFLQDASQLQYFANTQQIDETSSSSVEESNNDQDGSEDEDGEDLQENNSPVNVAEDTQERDDYLADNVVEKVDKKEKLPSNSKKIKRVR